jgi:hypothetical protein
LRAQAREIVEAMSVEELRAFVESRRQWGADMEATRGRRQQSRRRLFSMFFRDNFFYLQYRIIGVLNKSSITTLFLKYYEMCNKLYHVNCYTTFFKKKLGKVWQSLSIGMNRIQAPKTCHYALIIKSLWLYSVARFGKV